MTTLNSARPRPARSVAPIRSRVRGFVKTALLLVILGWTAWIGLQRPNLTAAEAALAREDNFNALRLALDDLQVFRLSRASSLVAARAFSREIYPDDAEPYYRFASRFGALPLAAQHDRIQGLFRGVKTEQGVALCREVLTQYPDDPETLRFLATVEWKEGRLPEARDAAQRLAKTKSGQIDGLDLLASIERSAEKRDRAVAACEAILKLDPGLKSYKPNVSGFWTEFTEDLVILHRSAEAREYLSKVIGPYSDPVLLDILGSACKELRDDDAAEQAWRESIRRDPKRMNPWLRLGNHAIDRKRFAEAADVLEKAVAISPDHVAANYLLARAYRFLNRIEDADKLFKKTEELRLAAPPTPGGMGPSS